MQELEKRRRKNQVS